MRHGCGLLVALICACGGGGGTLPANGNGGSAEQDAAQQVLEGCGGSALDEFLDLVEIFEGLLDPAETNPASFAILDVDPDGALVNWTLDLDGNQTPDIIGTLLFSNDQGEPETAADVNLLASGFDDLDVMLASLPDNTRLILSGARPEPPPFDLAVTAIIIGGVVDSVSGMANVQDVECQSMLEFDGESLQDVGGDYPSFTLTIFLATPDGAVEGTMVFDGTNQARAEVTLGGEPEVFAFLINLDTGAVTPTQ